jgi:hypothetical protein
MSALRWIRHGVFIIVQVGNTGGCMNRLEMVTQLVQNEIDWLVGDPSFENVQSVVKFFSSGGFGKYSDEDIEHMYANLMA